MVKGRRNADLRRRRQQHRDSLRQLARRFSVSVTRVVQILDETGGDPVREDLSQYTTTEVARMCSRLTDRIGSDLRQLLNAEEELQSRAIDRINGLPG